jgi:hypothetical protein
MTILFESPKTNKKAGVKHIARHDDAAKEGIKQKTPK